ncbi:ferric reductase-like transmembrane domain-containing protein [Oceanobacter sp. 3_MG-2023]|uniref:ferredoxin reductase family protein n=1 Tax=Oceanobacter sp. 3_MG-2023 TaxID=3062622 RepID=UPI00351DF2CC
MPEISLSKNTKFSIGYSFLLLILYFSSFVSPMDDKGYYVRLIILINLVGIAAFYLQFPLTGRLKTFPLFKNINWSVAKHKSMGYWIGGIFFLHPFLIMAPKWMLSTADGWLAIKTVLFAPEMLTGIIAWILLFVWVVFSALKKQLPLGYEVWRFWHTLGFIVITILATLHITAVGSHGQLQPVFNSIFWGLCCIAVAISFYNYAIKPKTLQKHAFVIRSIEKISSTDWQLTLTGKSHTAFDFDAGQFVWINTHVSPYSLDYHPFSIASCTQSLPDISFVIRELGDYTRQLDQLSVGQTVYLDGPFGQLTLDASQKAKGITLVAGGAGIGPMLGLLRQLAANHDPRPVRLLYGNKKQDQIVMYKEIKALEQSMVDFKSLFVCEVPTSDPDIHHGIIDSNSLAITIPEPQHWAVYLCGPEGMMQSVQKDLGLLHIPKNNIICEEFDF